MAKDETPKKKKDIDSREEECLQKSLRNRAASRDEF
jgi:hypothetical protein